MCSLVSGFLQGLVKICIKYIEANHFLLLNCSTRRQCIVFLSSLVALFGGICVSRGNYFRGKFYGEGGGAISRDQISLRTIVRGRISSRVIVRGAIV